MNKILMPTNKKFTKIARIVLITKAVSIIVIVSVVLSLPFILTLIKYLDCRNDNKTVNSAQQAALGTTMASARNSIWEYWFWKFNFNYS